MRGRAGGRSGGERPDVAATLPQPRNEDRKYVQPMEEIVAETLLAHLVFERAIRGRDDADVDGVVARPADGTNLTLLEDAKQLRLERRRRFGDLVQEKGPTVGDVEQPLLVADRPRESASFVTEELALEDPSERAAQLRATKRRSLRLLAAWMALATSSLPVPLSPSTRRSKASTQRERSHFGLSPWLRWSDQLDRGGSRGSEIGVLGAEAVVRKPQLIRQATVSMIR